MRQQKRKRRKNVKNPLQLAHNLNTSGCELLSEGKSLAAIDVFTLALDNEPLNPVIFSNRSAAFAIIKEYFYAYEDAINAINVCPQWPKSYQRKGQIEELAHQFTSAEQSYKDGLKVDPEDEMLQKALIDVQKKIRKKMIDNTIQATKITIIVILLAVFPLSIDYYSGGKLMRNVVLRWMVFPFLLILGAAISCIVFAIRNYQWRSRLSYPSSKFSEKRGGNDASFDLANATEDFDKKDDELVHI